MELSKILILSTAHLHPLEAAKIDKVAYISNDTLSLVSNDSGMWDSYLAENMHCLVDLLREVANYYTDVDYVMFDPDANIEDVFRKYEW
jgi:hypothetical protein